MASAPDTTGAPTRASSIARRTLLGALATAPAAALSLLPAAAATSRTAAWDRAIADYRTAAAANNAALDRMEATEDAALALYPAWPEFVILVGDTLDTAKARFERAKAAYKAARERADQRTGYAAAEQQRQATFQVREAALRTLLALHAPTVAAAADKLEIAFEEDLRIDDLNTLLRDLQRLGRA